MSNKSSAVVSALTSDGVVDKHAFVYEMKESLPNHAVEVVKLEKNISTANATVLSFDVVKAGILQKQHLKIAITTSAQAGRSENAIFHYINNISLSNNNRELERMTGLDILKYMSKLDSNTKLCFESAARVANEVEQATCTYYVMLPWSFSESMEKYLDTNFLDQLRVNVTFNAFSTVSGSTFSSATCELNSTYLVMEEEAYETYRKNNFKGDNLEMLWKNSFQENTVNHSGSETTTTFNLASDNVITNSTLYNTYEPTPTNQFGQVVNSFSAGVSAIELRGNGKELWKQDMAALLLNNPRALNVAANSGTDAVTFDGLINIDWTQHAKDMPADVVDKYTGGISLKNLSQPQIIVTHAASSGSNSRFHLNHEYLNFISIEPASGRAEISSAL